MPRQAKPAKKLVTQRSVDAAVWSICDVTRRGNVASAPRCVPELAWILFLRVLDEREEREAVEAQAPAANLHPGVVGPPGLLAAEVARPVGAEPDVAADRRCTRASWKY